MLGANTRQGEAANPGPSLSSFIDVRCGITNPTCLANKSACFRKLARTRDLHLVSMSETAATSIQQSLFARDLRAEDCSVLWGFPVLPHKNTVGIYEHVIGKASGVGLISRLAIRPSRHAFPDDWVASARIMHSICQVGPIKFQITTVYCSIVSRSQKLPQPPLTIVLWILPWRSLPWSIFPLSFKVISTCQFLS